MGSVVLLCEFCFFIFDKVYLLLYGFVVKIYVS